MYTYIHFFYLCIDMNHHFYYRLTAAEQVKSREVTAPPQHHSTYCIDTIITITTNMNPCNYYIDLTYLSYYRRAAAEKDKR